MDAQYGHRMISRRAVVLGAAKLSVGGTLAAALAGSGLQTAFAQGTPATSALTSLGLPELKITATDTGYEGLPATTAAGWYLMTLTVSGKNPASANFMQLPQGMSFADFQALMQSAAGTPAAGATMPAATAMAAGTPSAAANGAPPPWYYQVYMPGGAGALPGQPIHSVIELRPGNYVLWGEDPTDPHRPQALTVTGTAPTTPPTPAAGVTIQEVNTAHGYAFQIVDTFKAGPQVVKVINDSDQPHQVVFFTSPVALTPAQAQQLVMMEPPATPLPGSGLPNPSEVQPVAELVTQSSGTTVWTDVDLKPAHYIMACFVPDKTTGMPHAAMGMVSVLDVN